MTNGAVTSNFRRSSGVLDPRAGPCVVSKFHQWGEKTNRRAYVSFVAYDIPCLVCPRVRVLEYTKRGNRIAGYFTRETP